MKKVLIGAALITFVAVLGSCGKKDDALLLLPEVNSASASSAPGVPAEDLQPASTGTATGGGTVTEVTGGSANPSNAGSGSSGSSGNQSTGGGSSSGGSGSEGSGSSGSGSSGSTAGGSSGSGEGSGSGSSGSGSGSGSSGSGSGSSGSTGKTSLSYNGSEYSHVEGSWYQDGTVMFTYGSSPIGYSLEGLQPGNYRITITGMNWGSNGEQWALPDGFDTYKIAAAADGSSGTINLSASTSGFSSGSIELNISSGSGNLLLAFLNPTCGTTSGGSTKDSKSKDSKSKDSKSSDGKSSEKGKSGSKDSFRKDGKSSDSKSKDGKSSDDGKSRDGKTAVCHIPPGNPAAKHTILVGSSSVAAHTKHGDTVGACGPLCANFAIGTVKIERIGDATVTGGYLSGAKGKRNIAIALVTVLFAAGALFAINMMAKRKAQQ